jgi:CheY-like chemotaxis protein
MSVSILVVDDEPEMVELFRQRFRRETRRGTYVLHYATSGAEALDRLAAEIEPTLVAVLSDINMPGMDGPNRCCVLLPNVRARARLEVRFSCQVVAIRRWKQRQGGLQFLVEIK